ncbi:MAG: hypothetical protein M1829_003874 [Trizodia sp. TS-e1964]|nr:MAG: hypothetical protein M1829_003874 [Trizodia sp. TS-e1964]
MPSVISPEKVEHAACLNCLAALRFKKEVIVFEGCFRDPNILEGGKCTKCALNKLDCLEVPQELKATSTKLLRQVENIHEAEDDLEETQIITSITTTARQLQCAFEQLKTPKSSSPVQTTPKAEKRAASASTTATPTREQIAKSVEPPKKKQKTSDEGPKTVKDYSEAALSGMNVKALLQVLINDHKGLRDNIAKLELLLVQLKSMQDK